MKKESLPKNLGWILYLQCVVEGTILHSQVYTSCIASDFLGSFLGLVGKIVCAHTQVGCLLARKLSDWTHMYCH